MLITCFQKLADVRLFFYSGDGLWGWPALSSQVLLWCHILTLAGCCAIIAFNCVLKNLVLVQYGNHSCSVLVPFS